MEGERIDERVSERSGLSPIIIQLDKDIINLDGCGNHKIKRERL